MLVGDGAQRAVINKIRGPDGKCGAAHIEQCLLRAGPAATGPKTLGQNRGASHQQRLSEIQFHNADQDE